MAKKNKLDVVDGLKDITKKSGGFINEFKEFISKGNVLDMAVGVIIGGAFSSIVTALTDNILMPVINLVLGGKEGLQGAYTFLTTVYLDEAKTVIDMENSIFIDWGAFITAVINFLLIAFVLFVIIKVIVGAKNKMEALTKKAEEEKAEEPAEPVKSDETVLLEEIRDLLKKQK